MRGTLRRKASSSASLDASRDGYARVRTTRLEIDAILPSSITRTSIAFANRADRPAEREVSRSRASDTTSGEGEERGSDAGEREQGGSPGDE